MSQTDTPADLLYTAEHEWVRLEGEVAAVGLSAYAQDQLGDVTFVELPELGDELAQMGEMCVVESVKVAADVYAPLSGVVAEVNSALEEQPELINTDCYGAGWLVKIKGFAAAELDNLLDAAAYAKLLAGAE
jgi:glycine cleavage system H protein